MPAMTAVQLPHEQLVSPPRHHSWGNCPNTRSPSRRTGAGRVVYIDLHCIKLF